MTASLLDGKAIAAQIRADIKAGVQVRVQNKCAPPGLAVVLAGDDPASEIYVRNKCLACEAVGFLSYTHRFPETVSETTLIQHIQAFNQNPAIHGILVQLPLPKTLNTQRVIEHITPEKDVDGIHPYNIGRLLQRKPTHRPCTSYGIMHLLAHTKVPLAGKHAVVVGASNLVGRPMALELLLAKCTVSVCHTYTDNLSKHVREADILIVAVGKPHLIQGDWIKKGAIVIDVGMNRLPNQTLMGDVDFETAQLRAGWITPVPGGVGPMTIAMLLRNTWEAAQKLDPMRPMRTS